MFAATLAVLALVASAAGAQPSAGAQPGGRVAYLHNGVLMALEAATGAQFALLRNVATGRVQWSGDGRYVSVGTRVAHAPQLVTGPLPPRFSGGTLAWAPTGARLAHVTGEGGVEIWSPEGGRRTIAGKGWGVSGVAWSNDGRLAIGRSRDGRAPGHRELWVWNGSKLRLRLTRIDATPLPVGWTATGRVLWWAYPDSGSLAADGVTLYADRQSLAQTLMYPDFVVRCGRHLALTAGGDRYATHGKRILFDGRDVSHDASRSWIAPSCSGDGSQVVASAGRNWEESRFGREHRSIWQLLPARKQLTHPPAGWTDESPRLLADGSLVFVRTLHVPGAGNAVTERGRLELLQGGKLRQLADVSVGADYRTSGFEANYYGHYGWPWLVAVSP